MLFSQFGWVLVLLGCIIAYLIGYSITGMLVWVAIMLVLCLFSMAIK